ncbi:MAG TPA: flagellar biosynthesis anti-sigma factor FlgM [Kofleriaceae bacterium]
MSTSTAATTPNVAADPPRVRARGTKPPLTPDRVAQIRAQIDAGTYRPNLDTLAAHLIGCGALRGVV